MAFEEDINEFYGEFSDTVKHDGVSYSVMFFNIKEDVDGVYMNHVYFTIPTSETSSMRRGDSVHKGSIEYKIKSITDHNSDKTIKIIELEFVRDCS